MADIKQQRRRLVREGLGQIVKRVNRYLDGEELNSIEPILARLGRGGQLPHWYPQLRKRGTLPNLDGKTVGSVVEMLFVADVEKNVLKGGLAKTLSINPAKGVDVPDLDLGIKSPSRNWCTSEPFFSAYERLLGTEYDIVAVITNYQEVKRKPPLSLQLTLHHYFQGREVADRGLCRCARQIRETVISYGDAPARKTFRFLAHALQSDWTCKKYLELVCSLDKPKELPMILDKAIASFDHDSANRKIPLPQEDKDSLIQLRERKPLERSVIDAADDWVVDQWQEAARLPNDNEWMRLQKAPLDGQLGISYALQWRYNFGVFFKDLEEEPNDP